MNELKKGNYTPELLERLMNLLYLKEIGMLDNFKYEGNGGISHYAMHATNPSKAKEIIESGEMKSPLTMVADGSSIKDAKKKTISGRPRGEICYTLNETYYGYGSTVIAVPFDDLIEQGKVGFLHEGGPDVFFKNKDFDDETFIKYAAIAYGIKDGANDQIETVELMKEKIKTSLKNKKDFVLNIIANGVPQNFYSCVYSPDSLGNEGFNSPHTKNTYGLLRKIIDESEVSSGEARAPYKHSTELNEAYWDDSKYLIISDYKRDETGKKLILEKPRDYKVLELEKLLRGIEKFDDSELDRAVASYIIESALFNNGSKIHGRVLGVYEYLSELNEHSAETMKTEDLLNVLNDVSYRMKKDKANFFEKCKGGRFKLPESTVLIAPETDKSEWEAYFEESRKNMKRYYYKKNPKEFVGNKTQSKDLLGNVIKHLNRVQLYEGVRDISDLETGLKKIAIKIMTKENGHIADFGSKLSGIPQYEFNPDVYRYLNEVWNEGQSQVA